MSQDRSRRSTDPPHVQSKQGWARIPYEVELPEFWDPRVSSRPFQNYYRSLFLNAVVRHAPEVLQSLRTLVWEKLKPDNTNREELLARWTEQSLKQRFHLTNDWIVRRADQTLQFWSTDSGWLRDIGWPSLYSIDWSGELPEEQTAFASFLPALRWSVCGEPWTEFEQRATAAFHQSLKNYRQLMTELALDYGYQKLPHKRGRDGRHPLVAFDFLALWQVCGLTAEGVAAEFDTALDRRFLKKDAIRDQIRWAAETIGLTRRKPTGAGRPPRDSISK